MGDIGKGAAVDEGWSPLQRLNQVGLDSVLQKGGHGTLGLQVVGGDGFILPGVGDHHAGKTGLHVHETGGEAEHRHDLGGDGNVVTVLSGNALHFPAQTADNVAQLAVVHIHAAPPGDALYVDIQLVALLDMVIKHCGKQVVGRAHGMKVAGKVEVNVLHGHHLGIAAAGGSALDAEHGTQGRLPQGQRCFLSQKG
ncbi:hypothetical protein SDC9_58958 [bioreactor metagenome]|uniref:Uncharacterized protein n=1 Tax=bioreactor metagenome TaxID=1076179 RepID=A0A644XEL4_9ZZZZ